MEKSTVSGALVRSAPGSKTIASRRTLTHASTAAQELGRLAAGATLQLDRTEGLKCEAGRSIAAIRVGTMSDDTWTFVLLGLRVAVCVALYLFLLAAFRTLRAELRRPATAAEELAGAAARVGSSHATAATAPAIAQNPMVSLEASDVEALPPPVASAPAIERAAVRRRARRQASATSPLGRSPLRNAIIALTPLLILGSAAVLAANARQNEQADAPPVAQATEAPTASAPAPGRVAVGLRAQEDSSVRVTVDSVVQFSGVLRAGQHQRWEGSNRIQVWTDKGKTLLLSVNGHDLGPYSPAMGHPDWNRIDFAFAPSWRPS
jgi:hypothetical protein